MSQLSRYRIHLGLFAVGLVVFGATAGSRLWRRSSDPHFVLLADAWLNGRLDIDPAVVTGDDRCTIETVELRDGRRVRGRAVRSRGTFRIAGGDEIDPSQIARRKVATTYYVSFPPFPAVVMLPLAAASGHRANDVLPTVLIAALCLPLMFSVLRRLSAAGLSRRRMTDDLWLVAALAFGSVMFFSSVQGRVWYTAHVVGVALVLCYVWCTIEARHPILAGLCLGLATMTRTPLAFMFPLFALEAWRVAGLPRGAASPRNGLSSGDDGDSDDDGDSGHNNQNGQTEPRALAARVRAFVRTGLLFAAPVVAVAAIAMIHNYVRFGEPLEFGHSYLAVRQQQQMEALGLFSHHYLSRNLSVAFALLPDITAQAPHLSISGHGLAMWFTTPLVVLVLWPRARGPWHRPLWITVALVAAPSLLYQNSGWVQFGYRFALDYLVFLLILVAVGGRPLGRVARALIVVAIAINLFGAITFARYNQYYRFDRGMYPSVYMPPASGPK